MRAWVRLIEPSDVVGWMFFIHYVDDLGTILGNPDALPTTMDLASDQKPYFYLHKKLAPPSGATKIAIGFYRGNTVLRADKGVRDWDGKRVLLPLALSAP